MTRQPKVSVIFYMSSLVLLVLLIGIPFVFKLEVSTALRKAIISAPIVLIIIGNILSAMDKKKDGKNFFSDISMIIGFTGALTIYLLK